MKTVSILGMSFFLSFSAFAKDENIVFQKFAIKSMERSVANEQKSKEDPASICDTKVALKNVEIAARDAYVPDVVEFMEEKQKCPYVKVCLTDKRSTFAVVCELKDSEKSYALKWPPTKK